MTSEEYTNTSISQDEIERHAKDIRQMKKVLANQQFELDNSIRMLDETINAYKPLQAEFEVEEKKVAEIKKRCEEDGASIAKEKEKWNAMLVTRTKNDNATALDDEEGMKVQKESIQLAKKKLEDVAVAEERWQKAKEIWAEAESRLADCANNLATLKNPIESETRRVKCLEGALSGLQKEIDKTCALIGS
mmetsp:Transcript_17469/g.35448  ORF Transcript_17469/g.35448 Transcript_17469/m.35448 type:complete len:191 (-) Transcript_17469:245-817(-)